MKTTLKNTITSKSQVTINAGEPVTVAFDVPKKDGSGFSAGLFSLTADDGRRVLSRNVAHIGKKVPGVATLERWSDNGVCKTPFGGRTEPDGWTDGAPSWLLFLGMI